MFLWHLRLLCYSNAMFRTSEIFNNSMDRCFNKRNSFHLDYWHCTIWKSLQVVNTRMKPVRLNGNKPAFTGYTCKYQKNHWTQWKFTILISLQIRCAHAGATPLFKKIDLRGYFRKSSTSLIDRLCRILCDGDVNTLVSVVKHW